MVMMMNLTGSNRWRYIAIFFSIVVCICLYEMHGLSKENESLKLESQDWTAPAEGDVLLSSSKNGRVYLKKQSTTPAVPDDKEKRTKVFRRDPEIRIATKAESDAVLKYADVGGNYFKPVFQNPKHLHDCRDPTSDEVQQCFADIVFLGVSKCGTTSMSGYLRKHPMLEGFRPLGGGEDQVFDKPGLTMEQITTRYWGIARPQSPRDTKLTFHYDPQYSYFSTAPRSIFQFFPSGGRRLKLMMLIRDPVRRTHSSFYHRQRDSGTEYAEVEKDLAQQMQLFPTYAHCFVGGEVLTEECDVAKVTHVFDIGKSLYANQFEIMFKYFSPHQFLILTLEEFQADKRGTFQRVVDFLGVPMLGPNGFGSEEEITELLDMKRNSKPTPAMTEEMKKVSQVFFAPHNKRLYDLLGYKEPLWQYEYAP